MIEQIAAEFELATKALKALFDVTKSGLSARRKREITAVLEGLRHIYFCEERLLDLLNRLTSGKEIDLTDVDRTERGFLRDTDEALTALSTFEEFAERDGTQTSIKMVAETKNIIREKRGVRDATIDFLAEVNQKMKEGTLNAEQLAEQAQAVKDMIVELNDHIKDLDEILRKPGD
jgi:hypothetical protein